MVLFSNSISNFKLALIPEFQRGIRQNCSWFKGMNPVLFLGRSWNFKSGCTCNRPRRRPLWQATFAMGLKLEVLVFLGDEHPHILAILGFTMVPGFGPIPETFQHGLNATWEFSGKGNSSPCWPVRSPDIPVAICGQWRPWNMPWSEVGTSPSSNCLHWDQICETGSDAKGPRATHIKATPRREMSWKGLIAWSKSWVRKCCNWECFGHQIISLPVPQSFVARQFTTHFPPFYSRWTYRTYLPIYSPFMHPSLSSFHFIPAYFLFILTGSSLVVISWASRCLNSNIVGMLRILLLKLQSGWHHEHRKTWSCKLEA